MSAATRIIRAIDVIPRNEIRDVTIGTRPKEDSVDLISPRAGSTPENRAGTFCVRTMAN